MDDIKIVRTLQGEEILGNIKKDEDVYEITNPVVLHWTANEDTPNKPKLVMADLVPHSKDTTITINERHIVFVFNPMQEIVNEYNSVYGSGIVVPTPGDVKATTSLDVSDFA